MCTNLILPVYTIVEYLKKQGFDLTKTEYSKRVGEKDCFWVPHPDNAPECALITIKDCGCWVEIEQCWGIDGYKKYNLPKR